MKFLRFCVWCIHLIFGGYEEVVLLQLVHRLVFAGHLHFDCVPERRPLQFLHLQSHIKPTPSQDRTERPSSVTDGSLSQDLDD